MMRPKSCSTAISRAKSTDKKAIRDAIAQTKDFDGVSGKITIDENRNAKKSAVIIAVKNNAFDYAATIPNPDEPMPVSNKQQSVAGQRRSALNFLRSVKEVADVQCLS